MNNKGQYIYGVRPIEEAVRSGTPIEKVWVQAGKRLPSAVNQLRKQGVPVQYVPPRWFRKLGNVNHQGIVALIAPLQYQPLEEVLDTMLEHGNAIGIVLDGVSDVKNVGAIARSVYALGGSALFLPQKEGALLSEEAVKASAGALLHITVTRYPSPQKLIQLAEERGINIAVTTVDTMSEPIYRVNFEGPWLIVMGDEHRGVRPAFLNRVEYKITIPMINMDSLNVASATAVIMYEWLRQQRLSQEKRN